MNTETGIVRHLNEGEKPKQQEILVNTPNPDCPRCHGKGSIPFKDGLRAERRRAIKRGLPPTAKFMPCPECNE
jgi:hypothetical protein